MAHNGGLTQTNSTGLVSGLWQFWNLFKQAQSWSYRSNPTDANAPRRPVIELDADGYPTSIVAGTTGVSTSFFLLPVASYSGVYVITWDGGGSLLVPGNGTTTGFIPNSGYSFSNLTTGSGGGRFEFTLEHDSVGPSLSITATSAAPNNIRNIKIFRKTDETSGLAASGSVLGADFKAAMLLCKFGVFRSLGWVGSSANGTNDSDMAVWADRSPRTHYSYRAHRFIPSIYAGRTTRSGNSYTVTGTAAISDKLKQHVLMDSAPPSSWFNPVSPVTCSITNSITTGVPAVGGKTAHGAASGDIVVLRNAPAGLTDGTKYYLAVVDADTFKFAATRAAAVGAGPYINTSASAASTQIGFLMSLSIDGGSTFQPMSSGYFPTSADVSIGFNSVKPAANTMATVTYDQAIGYWHMTYNGATDCGILSGVPPEVFVDACAEMGMHPHIVAPFQTMETGASVHSVTDFMPSWATYIRDTYAWMKPVIEPPNETWNGGSAVFRATPYASGVAWERWGVTSSALYEAYGKWTSTLGQAVSAVFSNDRSRYSMICAVQTALFNTVNGTNDPKLKSTQYVSSNSGDPAYKWVDRVCAATYFNPAERFSCQELIDAYAHQVTYSGNAAQQSIIAEAYAATSGISVSFTREYAMNCITNVKAWAQGMPGTSTIAGFVAYEGGYSPDYLTGNWTTGITAATNANPCVLTLAATSSNPEKSGMTGNPAVVGMTVDTSGVAGMAELNPTLSFTNGSASISATNKFVAGQIVVLATSGLASMPTNFSTGVPYYVLASGLSGAAFQLSTTLNGSAIVAGSAGSGTIIANTRTTITKVGVADGLSANQIAINVDASGFSAYTSGGTLTYVNSQTYSNNLRKAGKGTFNLGSETQKFVQAYYALASSGFTMENFSYFVLAGTGSVWPMLDPDYLTVPRTYLTDIVRLHNNGQKRFRASG